MILGLFQMLIYACGDDALHDYQGPTKRKTFLLAKYAHHFPL